MKTLQISLPNFYGFYESPLDINGYIEIDNGDYEGNMSDKDYENIDWKATNNKVAEKYFDTWKKQNEDLINQLGIDITFSHVESPKFYNYSSDELICNVTFDEVKFKDEVLTFIDTTEKSFVEFIEDKYTSYSGFHSFYSNDYDTWVNEYVNNIDNVIFEGFLEFMQDEDTDSLINETLDVWNELIEYK